MMTKDGPRCDMVENCQAPVTHIDEKGFIYCKPHGIERRQYRRCRQLRQYELKKIQAGKPLKKY